jgi:tetratricopeptide (TPR) repeat protein
MLSNEFSEVKRLRSGGNHAAAFALIQASPITSDDDAFEAMVCLFTSGNYDDVIDFRGRHRWQTSWGIKASQALSMLAQRQDPRAALDSAKGAINEAGAPIDVIAIFLILLQVNGRLDEAVGYVQAHVQNPPASEVLLMTVVADIAVASYEWGRAYSLGLAVLAADPDNLRALAILSIASFELGSAHESLGYALRASHINAEVPMVVLQLMRCHNKFGDYYSALAAFNKLSEPRAITPEMHAERGVAYSRLRFTQKAMAAYQSALESPRKPEAAIRGMLALLAEADDPAQLQEFVKRHEREIHNDVESVYVLGLQALGRGELEQSLRMFGRSRSLVYAEQAPLQSLQWPVPEPRVRHDREQLDLLEHRGKLPAPALPALQVLRKYSGRGGSIDDAVAPSNAQEAQALRKALTDLHYYPDQPFAGKALGENDYRALEEGYFASTPSLTVIDNFLSASALEALREFCEEATVWRNYKSNGYVGVTLGSGFAPRVLLSVADELRQKMPRVIGSHKLTQAWAFKYDQRLRGINMHADFAVVNVNFWITPEDACLDKETGGMVIYDVPAPRDWTAEDYNGDPGKMEAYIAENNAQARRVPYKENRCVLFDSTLLHTTDRFSFKPGYCNRRVNVTLLYGRSLSTD